MEESGEPGGFFGGIRQAAVSAYYEVEDAYYAAMDWLEENSIPVYDNFVYPLEDRKIPSFPVAVLLLLLLVGLLLALSFSQQGATITVKVVSGGTPVENALIWFDSVDSSETLVTDSLGQVQSSRLRPGQIVTVSVRKANYIEAQKSFTVKPGLRLLVTLEGAPSQPVQAPYPGSTYASSTIVEVPFIPGALPGDMPATPSSQLPGESSHGSDVPTGIPRATPGTPAGRSPPFGGSPGWPSIPNPPANPSSTNPGTFPTAWATFGPTPSPASPTGGFSGQASNSYPLYVSVQGSGILLSNPPGILCLTNCSSSFNAGSSVSIEAKPGTGSVFSSWRSAKTGILVPLHRSSAGASWNGVEAVKRNYPGVPIVAVANLSNGPGSSRDAQFSARIASLSASGVVVIGYVTTRDGARPLSEVRADLDSWKGFYPEVAGVFFGEQPSDAGHESYYSSAASHARSSGLSYVVGSPEGKPAASYYQIFDSQVVYRGSGTPDLAGYQDLALLENDELALVSYGVSSLSTAWVKAASGLVGLVYVTNAPQSNPGAGIPSYLDDLASQLSGIGGPDCSKGKFCTVSLTGPKSVQAMFVPSSATPSSEPSASATAMPTPSPAPSRVVCSASSVRGDVNGDGVITREDAELTQLVVVGFFHAPSNLCCIDLHPRGAPDGVVSVFDLISVLRAANGIDDFGTCSNPRYQ